MAIVFMFPGQSSRYPGLLAKLIELEPSNGKLLDTASAIIGRDLADHYRADNPDAFTCNTDVQVGVFLANHFFLELAIRSGVQADASLGLSLGEWNHLVHIGAIGFEDALRAVAARGAAYDNGPRGMMAAVFPLDLETLESVVAQAQELGVVEVVNLNSPRQNVISGEVAAVEKAVEILDDEYYISAVVTERQVPMHASIFEPAGAEFRKHLATIDWREPALPYLPNRKAAFDEEPDYVERLATHIYQPVRWRESIDFIMERFPGATLVEVGPKRVLHNLLDRKWHKGVSKFHLDSAEDFPAHFDTTIGKIRETA